MMRPTQAYAFALFLCACGSSSSSGGLSPDGGAGLGGNAGASGNGGSAGITGTGGASGSGTGGTGALGSSFGPPEVLADKQTNCYRVGIAGGRVFWNSRGSVDGVVPGGLFSIPLDGGTIETHHASGVYALKVISNQIYFSDVTTIFVMQNDGSAKSPLVANAGTALDVATQNTTLWFSTDPGKGTATLQNAPITGGPAVEVVSSGSAYFTYLAAKDQVLYAVVLQTSGAPTSLYRIPIEGGQSEVVSDAHTAQLSMDAQHVYFASQLNPLRFALSGGSPVEIMGDQAGVAGTAVDADALYVTADESQTCEAGTGKVWRIPFATKTPELIADGLDCPAGIAVDASAVYWVNAGTHLTVPSYSDPETGTLMRAKRL
jgi:hypothetical protein